MKIRPTDNWKLLGTSLALDKTKVYEAVPATNQPNWQERKAIFVVCPAGSMLLEGDEYTIEA
jgi:hypothetical protein